MAKGHGSELMIESKIVMMLVGGVLCIPHPSENFSNEGQRVERRLCRPAPPSGADVCESGHTWFATALPSEGNLSRSESASWQEAKSHQKSK